MADHARRSSPKDCPLLHRFMGIDMDERWVNRTPQTMLETFHWFRGEGFNLIIEDLLGLSHRAPLISSEPRVIVEGFRLLPHLVKPLLSEFNRAVWLLPTPEFRHAVLERRGGSAWGFLAKTSNPQIALSNLLERDRMFTERLRDETARLGLHTVDVDNTTTEAALTTRVKSLFGL